MAKFEKNSANLKIDRTDPAYSKFSGGSSRPQPPKLLLTRDTAKQEFINVS